MGEKQGHYSMNRRDFLKVVASSAAMLAVPALAIPNDAKLVENPSQLQTVIGGMERDITWHPDRGGYLVLYTGTINNKNYYVGDFVEKIDDESLKLEDEIAMNAFRGRYEQT